MAAPIALFVYKRLWHTQKTVEALSKNTLAPESDLIIFSDGPKNESDISAVEEVRHFTKSISGFRSVELNASETNKGLARSIIAGVTHVVNKYGTVVVVEDDLVTSPYFLDYMNQGLKLYEHDDGVISIHGCMYPVRGVLPESFFLRGADCWGWATWQRGWALFEADASKLLEELDRRGLVKDFEFGGTYPYRKMLEDQIAGRVDSWAIRWYASAYLKGKMTLYPGVSLVNNIGHDNSGTHSGSSSKYEVALQSERLTLKRIPIVEDTTAKGQIARYFQRLQRLTPNRIARAGLKYAKRFIAKYLTAPSGKHA